MGKYSTLGQITVQLCEEFIYVIVKALLRVCMENTAQGKAECCICLETPPECCIFRTHTQGGALTVTLYFLVVWLGVIFSSTQTAAIFGDQDISKCLTDLFLVVE